VAVFAADVEDIVFGLKGERLVARLADDGREAFAGDEGLAGLGDIDLLEAVTQADLLVVGGEGDAVLGGGDPDALEDGLGRAGEGNAGGGVEGFSQGSAITDAFHGQTSSRVSRCTTNIIIEELIKSLLYLLMPCGEP
jgi:hypothetical protein